MLLGACGPAHPVAPPSEEPPQSEVKVDPSVASELNFKIMAGNPGSRAGHPLRLLEENPVDFEPVISGNQIAFGRPIPIQEDSQTIDPSRRNALYLVWQDRLQGIEIVGVSVHHMILNGNSRWRRSLNAVPTWHDHVKGKWVVSFFEISRGASISQVTEMDTQVLDIELTLSNTSKVHVQVRFSVKSDSK